MTAGGSVRLSNGTILTSTLSTVISTGSGGTGGDITFNVRNFTATDSIVSAAVRDGGSGGAVTIQGLDDSGHFANTVALTNTTINTSSAGLPGFPGPPRADGGPITVHADHITINQSTLNALSNETTGGPISLTSTNQIATQNSSFITASFFGSGGTVDLRAGTSIQLINTSLNAHGSNFKGGDITVAGHKVSLMGSTLDVSSGGIFDAGTIHLTGINGIALNGTVLLADSALSPPFPISSHPNGGTIHMDAGAQFTSNQSTISAHSILGNGGFIRIEANKVGISNTTMTTSVTGGPQTTAGTITLNGHNITLDNSQLLSTATEGHGGTITIQTHEFRRDASSLLDVRGGGGGGFVIVKPLP
jgi:lipopolysaccharide export system protein LptA